MKHHESPRNLLAINFGGIGDEVLFLPTLKSIRKNFPNCKVTLLTEPRSKSIMDVTDLVDNNLTFDIKKRPLLPGDYVQLVKMLRAGGFDTVVSSGSSPQVAALLFLSGIPRRVGFSSNRLAPLLLTNPVPLNREQHAIHMYHDLVRGLGIMDETPYPEVLVAAENVAAMEQALGARTADGAKRPLVLLHPGTSRLAVIKGIIKTWAASSWAELIRRLRAAGADVVLAGGPDDEEPITAIMKQLGDSGGDSQSGRFINAYGKTRSLKDLVALISLSDLMICVDSAPMHLAVGVRKNMIALFGPTDPEKLLLKAPEFVAFKDSDFRQRPDSSHSSLQSERGVAIPPDIVFQAALDRLNLASNQGSSLESHQK